MGTDIHFYLEKKTEEGNWESADKWSENEYHLLDPDNEPEFNVSYTDCSYVGRNYDLFAVLSDVRNGFGFGLCDTGDGFIPICKPKGLPLDVSDKVKKESDRWGGDGHSHNFLTVKELLNFDWTQTTKHRGWVNGPVCLEYFRDLSNGSLLSQPSSYSGGVGGPNTNEISVEEMEETIQGIRDSEEYQSADWQSRQDIIVRETSSYYCQLEWEVPYYTSSGGEFWGKTIPIMCNFAAGDFDSVRCVFWFDN